MSFNVLWNFMLEYKALVGTLKYDFLECGLDGSGL